MKSIRKWWLSSMSDEIIIDKPDEAADVEDLNEATIEDAKIDVLQVGKEMKIYEQKPLDRWNKVTDLKFRMNTLLIQQLRILINNNHYDFDSIILIDGAIEGAGKSTLAQQVAYFLTYYSGTRFGLGNIVFTPKEFQEAVLRANKFDCILWDEAYLGSSKFKMSSTINQTIMMMLQQIRQKNLYILVVLPYFFDLNSYVAVPRSWFLIHVYIGTQIDTGDLTEQGELDWTKPIFQRGFFRFFSRERKQQLYYRGRKEYNYSYVKGNFIGMFPRVYTVDEAAYKEKKANIKIDDKGMLPKDWVVECIKRGIPISMIADHCPEYKKSTIFDIQKDWRKEQAKEAGLTPSEAKDFIQDQSEIE